MAKILGNWLSLATEGAWRSSAVASFPDAGDVAEGVDRGDGTLGTRIDAAETDVRSGVVYGDPTDPLTGELELSADVTVTISSDTINLSISED
jgi:hypothetical protein